MCIQPHCLVHLFYVRWQLLNKSALAELGQLFSTLSLNCYPWKQLKHKATKRLIEIRMLGHFSFKQNRWPSLPHFCRTWGEGWLNACLTPTHAYCSLKEWHAAIEMLGWRRWAFFKYQSLFLFIIKVLGKSTLMEIFSIYSFNSDSEYLIFIYLIHVFLWNR